jgi:hypothetical protein
VVAPNAFKGVKSVESIDAARSAESERKDD